MPTLLAALSEESLSESHLNRIREAAGDDYHVVRTTDEREAREHVDDAEVAFGWFPPSLLPEADALQWIQSWAAGTDWLFDREELTAKPDLVVTTSSGVHAAPVAEHVLGMLTMLARRFPSMLEAQRERRWAEDDYTYDTMMELTGGTLVLVGTGAIGQRIARLASALDMHITGVRRTPSAGPVPHITETVGPEQLHDALATADATVVTLPKTPKTEGLFDQAAFAAMKPGALFVNVGRGEVVREKALVEALRAGHLRGAGLDVFEDEPLPADSPLWAMANVALTPHVAGITPHYPERATTLFIENLRRWRRGLPLNNLADRGHGY